MKLAKTIRLDGSDANIFPSPSEPGEWAVTGTFSFVDADQTTWSAKEKIAFKSGWLGLNSFGRSTLVQIASISESDFEQCIRQLATHLFSAFGAPDMLVALDAARQELTDMATLCTHPVGTLLAIGRESQEDGIAEQVRLIPAAKSGDHARIWEIEPSDS